MFKKKALIVGINKYASRDDWELRGCVNDANDIQDLLVEVYDFVDINLLLDSDATKSNVLDGLDWLVDGARPGDILVYYQSSHGTQVVDYDGDEIDRLDECSVMYDAGLDVRNLLLDDDVYRYVRMSEIRGALMYIIFDFCHSGTADRDSGLISDSDEYISSRYISPKEFSMEVKEGMESTSPFFSFSNWFWSFASKDIEMSKKHVFMSASLANEVSYETFVGDDVRGLFTYAFTKFLREDSLLDPEGLRGRCLELISKLGFKQTPMVSGMSSLLSLPIFGGFQQ